MLLPAITGKVEMVYEGEQQGSEVVAKKLIGEAVKARFLSLFPAVGKELGSGGEEDTGPYADMVRWFASGGSVTLTDEVSFADHAGELVQVPGLMEMVRERGYSTEEDQMLAAETILEGLHQHLKLGREDLDSQVSYKEMLKFQRLRPGRGRGRDVN
jgi:magnesium chelatase subunit I